MSRYIDADKLIELANNTKDKTIDANDIARFPIADVRENVRGEWIEDNPREKSMMWRCSVCGRIAYYPTIGERKSYKKHCGYNFCPNCGADMRPITALSKNAEIDSNQKEVNTSKTQNKTPQKHKAGGNE